jgi:hypothetical protein
VELTDAVVDTGVTMIKGARMFEALADEARFRFVNVVR